MLQPALTSFDIDFQAIWVQSVCAATARVLQVGNDPIHSFLREENKGSHIKTKWWTALGGEKKHQNESKKWVKRGQWLHRTGVGERLKKRTQTGGNRSEEKKWRGKGELQQRGLQSEGTDGQRGANKLSCGYCRSQTGSPDDTSVGLTHPDSLIPLLKTCMEQQTTQRGKENTHHSEITWCFGPVSVSFIKHQITILIIILCWRDRDG